MSEVSPYPPSVRRLIEHFARLPGIGKRSAERMAYHVLTSSREEAMDLAFAIRDVKKNIRACSRCFHVAEEDLCAICQDAGRDHGVLCVVELPRDIIALEKTGAYRGVYHVLQGHLSPADGVGPESLRIEELQARLAVGEGGDAPVREIILAMNPSTEGDATASFLGDMLKERGIRISRLARGLASGTDLESTTPSSLQFALEGRQSVE